MTLFEKTLADAALERYRSIHGARLVSFDQTVAEDTVMGRMFWYLHPELVHITNRSLYMHTLEIEPSGHSGRLQTQGGQIHYVLSGAGYTELDGIRHRWVSGDVIAIPLREEGVHFQHFSDGETDVRMIVVWPNLDSALGPEAGVEMKVMSPASRKPGNSKGDNPNAGVTSSDHAH